MSSGDHKEQSVDHKEQSGDDGYENGDSDHAAYSGGESDDEHAAAERSGQHDEDECTLFVKNLDQDITEEQLKAAFPDSTKIRIPLREDGYPKGFAYLVFGTSDEVQACIDDKQGLELNGAKLYLDFEGKNSKSKPSKRRYGRNSKSLYVSKLATSVTSEILQEAFPNAKSARVIVDKDTDDSRGFGFVEFETHKEAEEALAENKGKEIEGQEVILDFAAGPRGGYRGGYGRGGGYRYQYGDGWDYGYGGYDRGYDRYGGYPPFRGYGRAYYRGGRGGGYGQRGYGGGGRRGYGRSRGYYY